MKRLRHALLLSTLALLAGAGWAQKPGDVGVVLMHGLNGNPTSMATLAYELREKGHLVADPELPWSGMRNHDVTTDVALQEVARQVELLRRKGAGRIVLVGFSKGGLFAAHAASRLAPDALVLISPIGLTRAADIEAVQRLQAEGKGAVKGPLELLDPIAQRRYPIFTTPDAFLSWFGPGNVMQVEPLLHALPPDLPVLLVVATRDFDSLLAMKQSVFDRLPPHPAKRMFEPDSNHIGAVNAASVEVARWIDTTLPPR